MVLERGTVATDYAADDEERNAGSCCAAEEERAAADFVDKEERGECTERVDDAVDARGEEAGGFA